MANFSVAARTLIHLGAELITSDEVALNELIKNSFDADSPRVRIEFHILVPQVTIEQSIENINSIKNPENFKKCHQKYFTQYSFGI